MRIALSRPRRLLAVLTAALVAAVGLGTSAAPASAAPNPGAWNTQAPGYQWQIHPSEGVWYRSPAGTFLVPKVNVSGAGWPDFTATHAWAGGGGGHLGYPTGKQTRQGSVNWFQVFERGVIYQSPSFGQKVVSGAFVSAHNAAGGGSGRHGYPRTNASWDQPGWGWQAFSAGTIYTSPRGAYGVIAAGNAHAAAGGGGGSLGYPTGGEVWQGSQYVYQQFERGVVYCMVATDSCATVKGGFVGAHAARGGGNGSLGYARYNEVWDAGNGRWQQEFERGWITITPSSYVQYFYK